MTALPGQACQIGHRSEMTELVGVDHGVHRLDHMSFAVAGHADLDAWAGWLDSLGIENSGVVDTADPVPYSVVVFRDPDNIQLELIYMAG